MKKSLIAVSVFALLGIFTADVQAKENGLTATQIQKCRAECVTGGGLDLEASNLENKCICKGTDGDTVDADDVDPKEFK